MRPSDTHLVCPFHPTRRCVGSEPNLGRQHVKLRRSARRRRRGGGFVPVDRLERGACPERPAEFREERRSGLDPRRRRADVQREQPPLVQRHQQPRREHRFLHWGLGLSNNNAFGRLWPANAPFGDAGVGSSTILDPTGLPLKGAPNPVIGGVYAGSLTNRNVVAVPQQPQVIPGSLSTGAVGTAFLGPSPDGSCRAVFSVVTADGAIVQESTLKGLDGLAPAGTVESLLGRSWDPPNQGVESRLGVLMNPYTATPGAAWQLFVSEPFNNTIAVVNLVVFGSAPNQVFGLDSVTRISSDLLKLPVDLAPVQRDADSFNWASNTTLDDGSDFYVANRGNNTIVRMRQDGSVVAIRRVTVDNS